MSGPKPSRPQPNRPQPGWAVDLALRCYSRGWKERHGEEAAQLAQMLASDGVPPASIAFSYLGGALRERLGLLARRRWSARAAALLATASAVATTVAMSTSPAAAGAAGVVRVEVVDRTHAAGELTAAFRHDDFPITVRQVGAPAAEVGTIVATIVTGPPSLSRPAIGNIEGPCASGARGCVVGLVIPANFATKATVLVGQKMCAATAPVGPASRSEMRCAEGVR
jgi:hypothetical protein